MPKPEDRGKFRPESSQNRSRKNRPDAVVDMEFNIPAAVQEGEFFVVEATALRDRLNPGAPAPVETTAPEADQSSGDSPAPAAEQQPTAYRWSSLQDSSLKGPRRSELWDVVTNYRDGDQIDAPDTITTREITETSGSIRKLNPGQINSKGVGGEAFEANTARSFLYAGPNKGLQNGVFLVLNDGRPGYQHRTDAVIFLEGFSFGAGEDAGTVGADQAEASRKIVFWPPATIAPTPGLPPA